MPECVVCGLQDFEERDGLYFCTTCQTQTQDLFVEEDEFEQAADTGQAIVDHRLQIKQKTERAAKPQDYKGRLWTIYEAYQIILKHQVEAFIRLGADPKLEDFVFRLWAVYLSKLQVAFTEDEHLYPPTLGKHVRHREKYGGGVKESMTPSRRLVRHHKRHTVNKVLPAYPPVIEGEEFYEGDDPTQGPEELEEDLSTSEEEAGWGDGAEQEGGVEGLVETDVDNEEYFPHPGMRPKYTQTRLSMLRVMTAQPEWVSLPKLLSLCHLGLLYTNSAVTATDIVRLVEQGEIPYVEVSHLLPDNFKYSSYDPQLFLAQIPKPHTLRHLTGNLAYFLDISHLPPVPVSLLVSKYIVKLGLPGELHGLVMSVISQRPPQCRHTIRTQGRQARLPFYDGLAMAHIILTLKLWFGLDDSTEKELSAYSRELMEVLENKHDLFVFEDWKMHVACTLKPDQEVVSLFNHVDDKNVKDVEQVLESYYKCNLHLKRPGRHYVGTGFSRRDENSRYNKNVKEDIAMPFKLAAEKMEKTSNEASASLDQSDDPDVPMEEESSSEYRTRTRFACSSMKHITNPETFLKDLSSHGLTEDTLSSSCVDTDSESDYEIQYGMEDMSIDDYREFLAPKAKRHKSAAKEAVRTMYQKIQSSNQNISPEVQHQLNELRKRCVNARSEFIVYKRIWKKDRHVSLDKYRHRSYSWLVGLCARILRCSPHELDMMVLHLSKVHFSFSAKKAGILMPGMKSFLVKYYLPDEKSAD